MAVFDTITYSKGQAFIRMLEPSWARRTLPRGIRQYMKQHAFSSTTTVDLWARARSASRRAGESLTAFTELAGVPPHLLPKQNAWEGEQRISAATGPFSVHDPE